MLSSTSLDIYHKPSVKFKSWSSALQPPLHIEDGGSKASQLKFSSLSGYFLAS